MIELSKSELIGTNLRSSKGNQLKWLIDGYWYKADNNGYEGRMWGSRKGCSLISGPGK